jgi:hypothetical protein
LKFQLTKNLNNLIANNLKANNLQMKKLFFALAFGSLVACSENDKKSDQATEMPMMEQMADQKQYACPMRCEGDKTYEEAGTCPVCKMDLKEVSMMEADSTGHDH